MGLWQRLTSRKRVSNPGEWIGATVTPGDVATGRSFARNPEANECVRRATQWVEVCSRKNATVCASQCLRLYVGGSGEGERDTASFRTSRVGRKRVRHLRDADAVGQKLASYAEYAGDIEEVMEHPALAMLRNPNPWMSGAELLHHGFYSMEVAGNRYWHLVMAPGGYQLYPMAPQYTRVVPHATEFLAGYVYGRNGVVEARFTTDEVWHSKLYPSLMTPYYGVSPLVAMIGEADLDAAQLRSEIALWNNSARPDWALTLPPESSQATADAIEAKIESKFRGPSNRGRFLITTGSEPKPLMWSHREMEYVEGIQNVERRIWAAYGVPESEVRMNDSNLASSRTGSIQYKRDTIRPRCVANAEWLTQNVLPLFNIAPGEMFFAYDEIAPADEAATAARVVSLVGSRVLTQNEGRAELGFDPVDGGDEFPEPVSLAPMGEKPEPDKTEEDDAAEDKPAEKTHKRAHGHARKGIGVQIVHDMLNAAATRLFASTLDRIIPSVRISGAFDEDDLTAAMGKAIGSVSMPALQLGISSAASAFDGDTGFVPDNAAAAMRARSLRIAGDTTGTLSGSIKEALAKSMENGATRQEAYKAVADLLPDQNKSRAMMIADTELSRAYIAGNAIVYKRNGVKRLVWDTAADPCPVCEEAAAMWNAKNIGIDDVFDKLMNGPYATPEDPHPPQHPRCRCDLIPEEVDLGDNP